MELFRTESQRSQGGFQEVEFHDAIEQLHCFECKTHSEVFMLEECYHTLCKQCLSEIVEKTFPDSTCPVEGCKKLISHKQLREVLGQETFEALEHESLHAFLATQPNIATCPCGTPIEVLPGDIPQDVVRENGKKLTKSAALHMSQHRIRCPNCK